MKWWYVLPEACHLQSPIKEAKSVDHLQVCIHWAWNVLTSMLKRCYAHTFSFIATADLNSFPAVLQLVRLLGQLAHDSLPTITDLARTVLLLEKYMARQSAIPDLLFVMHLIIVHCLPLALAPHADWLPACNTWQSINSCSSDPEFAAGKRVMRHLSLAKPGVLASGIFLDQKREKVLKRKSNKV